MTLQVFLSVTHLLGAGHLTRAAAIGRALARASHRVTLATGGMPAALVETSGLEIVQLPPVRAASEEFRGLCDAEGRAVDEAHLARRQEHLLAALHATRPDILVTELYPFGRRILSAEYRALLEATQALQPRPLIVCSLRDILVAPSKPDRIEETHRLVEGRYDAVLVHGDPRLAPLEASWPLPDRLRGRLAYTGYVDAEPSTSSPRRDRADILVSGGSSEAALPLYRAAIGAASLLPRRRWHLLVGRGVAQEAFEALLADAPVNIAVERARPDFRRLLGGARLFVGLAGYNTVVDLLATGTPAVLVPFERGRETEQRLRADRMAALRLAETLPEGQLSARTLAAAAAATLERPDRAVASIDCDGAAATVRILEALASRRPVPLAKHPQIVAASAPRPVARVLSAGLRETLRRDLDRLADAGRTLQLWWRDDDAVAATPALDRLLALARTLNMPVAIAAVPAFLETSLAQRLAGETAVRVLQHGWRHANHAPSGDKKAEFGANRLLADACDDIARGRSAIEAAFGALALPVFVPPWNRISTEIAAALPELGLHGLSCFGETAGDLPRVDTHLDPIDWHGTRTLCDEAAFGRLWRRALRLDGGATRSALSVGVLSHHLANDEAVWAFTRELLEEFVGHPAVHIPELAKLWPSASTRPKLAAARTDATPPKGVTGPWAPTSP